MRKQYPAASHAFQSDVKLMIILERSKEEYEARPEVIKANVQKEIDNIIKKVVKDVQVR